MKRTGDRLCEKFWTGPKVQVRTAPHYAMLHNFTVQSTSFYFIIARYVTVHYGDDRA